MTWAPLPRAMLALCAAALALPAAAQVAPPPARSGAAAAASPEHIAAKREGAKRLVQLMRKNFSDDEIGRIMYIGWYSAAAALCEDLSIDQAKLGAAIAGLMPADAAKLPADQLQHVANSLTLNIGVATGYVMASHVDDVPAVCAQGREAIASMPANKHLFRVLAAK